MFPCSACTLPHLVIFGNPVLYVQEVPGLLQLLDGFSVSSSQLSDGALCGAAPIFIHLNQEAQSSAFLRLTLLRKDPGIILLNERNVSTAPCVMLYLL